MASESITDLDDICISSSLKVLNTKNYLNVKDDLDFIFFTIFYI